MLKKPADLVLGGTPYCDEKSTIMRLVEYFLEVIIIEIFKS